MAETSKKVTKHLQDEVRKQSPLLMKPTVTKTEVANMAFSRENVSSIIRQPQVATQFPPQTQAQNFFNAPSTPTAGHGHLKIPTAPMRPPTTVALATPTNVSGAPFLSSGPHKFSISPIMTTSDALVESGYAKTLKKFSAPQQSEVVKLGTVGISSKGGINQAANICSLSTNLSSSNLITTLGQTTCETRVKGTVLRSPLKQTLAAKVKVAQSQAPLTKLTSSPTKPMTMSSRGTKHIYPQTRFDASTVPTLSTRGPNLSRMTVVSGQPQHSNNVALCPSSYISIPTPQNQQPMAKILAGGLVASHLISLPTSQNSSSATTIQKSIGTTAFPTFKALPGGMLNDPKTVARSGILVNRIIPQLTSSEYVNLYITSAKPPLLQPNMGEDGCSQLDVATLSSATNFDLTSARMQTPQKNCNEYRAAKLNIPVSPKPGILKRRPVGVEGRGIMGEEMQTLVVVPSPKKKPRKQQYLNVLKHSCNELISDQQDPTCTLKRKYLGVKLDKTANNSSTNSGFLNSTGSYIENKPKMSLLSSYRHTWKSRQNHFFKYSDIAPQEERRPTISEIASQTNVQKLEGWKIYHMSAQIENLTDMEIKFCNKLAQLQITLDSFGHKDLAKDIAANQEIIMANLQRSKLIQVQMSDARRNCIKVFEHKTKVSEIMGRYSTRSRRREEKKFCA